MSTDTDTKIQQAFERLMLGRPEITDGTLTISNICAEAGVSRASYYRSPQAVTIKRALDTPQTPRPEIEDLRAQLTQLNKTERELRSQHAAEIRELRDTIKTYANQIQSLALGNAQLQEDNQRLRSLPPPGDNITPLNTARHREVSDTPNTIASRPPTPPSQP
jgi:FtsZ-binding cell division protein ZapB